MYFLGGICSVDYEMLPLLGTARLPIEAAMKYAIGNIFTVGVAVFFVAVQEVLVLPQNPFEIAQLDLEHIIYEQKCMYFIHRNPSYLL